MYKILVPFISIIIGGIGFLLGIILGSLLGRVGSLEILRFILKIPVILIKSPKKIKSKWRMWQELKDSRKAERLDKQRKIEDLKEKIGDYKKEIKKIKVQIRRLRWEFSESKEEA